MYASLFIFLLLGTALWATISLVISRRAKIAEAGVKAQQAYEQAVSSRPQKDYGHPKPPVSYLRSRLPKIPDTYRWEIVVTLEKEKGYRWLRLNLLNLTTSTVVAATSVNLTVSPSGYPKKITWAEYYNKYSSIAQRNFEEHLIAPLLGWAEVEANKIDTNDNDSYDLR